MALERHPAAARAMVEAGHEIASHGWRWIDYQNVAEEEEREHMPPRRRDDRRGLRGAGPLGWYTGRLWPNTRRLVVEHGGFLYDADSYADDLPSGCAVGDTPHLVVPYTLDANDMRFAHQGFNSGEQCFAYLKDGFDVLYARGRGGAEDDVGRASLRALSRRPRPRRTALGAFPRLRGEGHDQVWTDPRHRRRPALDRHHPCRAP